MMISFTAVSRSRIALTSRLIWLDFCLPFIVRKPIPAETPFTVAWVSFALCVGDGVCGVYNV